MPNVAMTTEPFLLKLGGMAAFVAALTYLFGLMLLVAVFLPAGLKPGGAEAAQSLNVIADHKALYDIWIAVIYKLNSGAIVVLGVALALPVSKGRFASGALIVGFAVLWAGLVLGAGMVASVGAEQALALYTQDPVAAGAFWRTVQTIELGLGGGNEIAGTFWILAVSLVGLAYRTLPWHLVTLGILIAISGILTVFEWTGETPGAVFGIGTIIWFTAMGLRLFLGFDGRDAKVVSAMRLATPS